MRTRLQSLKAAGKLLLLLFAFALPFGINLAAPQPAYAGLAVYRVDADPAEEAGWAQDLAHWLKNLALLGDIITGIKKLYTTVSDWYDKWVDQKKKNTVVESAGQQAQVEAKTRLTQAKLDAGPQDELLYYFMRHRAKTAAARNEYLCKSILIHQLALTTDDFYKGVARYVAGAIEHRDRFQDSDGNGPKWAAESLSLRQKNKFGSFDTPSSWQDKSTTGANGRSLRSADLSAATMDGEQTLEMPKLDCSTDGNGVTSCVPNPQNAEQRFWVAGLYHCFDTAGPRPSPPWGDSILKPKNLSGRSFWDSLASGESALTSPCAELLAYYTRPNDEQSTLRDVQDKKCQAAIAAKVIPEGSFDSCSKGLSKYQAEYIEAMSCKANQPFLSSSHGGGKDPKMMDSADVCMAAWYTWKESVEARKKKAVSGTSGLIDMAELWASLSGQNAEMGWNKDRDDKAPRRQARAEGKRSTKAPKVEKIRDIAKPAVREKGVPVPADEMTWPEAVAQ